MFENFKEKIILKKIEKATNGRELKKFLINIKNKLLIVLLHLGYF